ncbi:hypothetical protein ABZ070_30180 [Streptomyces sp. NPDC006283]|uniref:hypothetical protein n=1 Tax=Streptomyces sp. NPDC006283 TaxID=3156741 RepID=UPI0033AAD8C8
MTFPQQSRRRSLGGRILVAAGVAVALLAGGVLWAANNMGKIKEWVGGAWDLTYEGTALSGDPQATAVRYRHNPDRYRSDVSDERLGPTQLPWSSSVLVNTGQDAFVEVTPAENTTASCRILLDGVRVVAEGKSPAPGKPAVCKVTTSSTPEKWPR